MRPEARDIAVPPLPLDTVWIGSRPGSVERICARGPLLVQFFDAAHVSSVRTLPYVLAWAERYGELGLSTIGVNSPRFPFTGDPRKLTAALSRLGIRYPVAADSRYAIWHGYGCRGWPSLFLWGMGGALRWFHFGEGEYRATEEAIQAELRAASPAVALPEPLEPIRPSDAPGALVAPPSEEVFPGGSTSEPMVVGKGDPPLELAYAAGGAWATLDGRGELRLRLDGEPERPVEVTAPGAYELTDHGRHESHRLSIDASPGLAIYSVGFAAGIPPPRRSST
jgi:hypothetical protein